MHPELFSIGPLGIKTYGVCMAVGFLVCWKVIERLSGRKDLADLMMYLMFAGVVGGRVAYVVEHWKAEFAGDPLTVLRVDRGGLVFYGGLILSMAVFFAWCWKKRERPLALADLLCVTIPLGHAFGRVGCFFYGCCWGRVSASPLAVKFPMRSPAWCEQVAERLIDPSAAASLPVLPTQLFEAAALALLFVALLAAYLKWRRFTAGAYLVGYAAVRFGMEYLRGDPRAAVLGLSIGQAISICMALVGASFVALELKRREAVCHNR